MKNKIRDALKAEMDRVNSKQQIEKMYTTKILEFLQSPFVDDRVFAMNYMLQVSRDSIQTQGSVVQRVFFEHIHNLILNGDKNDLIIYRAF